MLVDAIVGWLVSVLGQAAASAGVRMTLGPKERRDLRVAVAKAVDRVVGEAPIEVREPLVRALRERFDEPAAVPRSGPGLLLESRTSVKRGRADRQANRPAV